MNEVFTNFRRRANTKETACQLPFRNYYKVQFLYLFCLIHKLGPIVYIKLYKAVLKRVDESRIFACTRQSISCSHTIAYLCLTIAYTLSSVNGFRHREHTTVCRYYPTYVCQNLLFQFLSYILALCAQVTVKMSVLIQIS